MFGTRDAPWFDRRDAGPPWPSAVVGTLATAAMFVVAFGAMRSVRQIAARGQTDALDAPIVLRFITPPVHSTVVRTPPPSPQPRAAESRAARPAAATPTATPTAVAPSITTPAAPTPIAADSAAHAAPAAAPPAIPLGILPPAPASNAPNEASPHAATNGRNATHAAAPVAPSGVTLGTHRHTGPAGGAAIPAGKAKSFADVVRETPLTPGERDALAAKEREERIMQTRATSAGNAHHLDGLGASSSIGFPLFSSGPSAAQRRANEKIDAENRVILQALRERLLRLRGDSVRADSLRRDSTLGLSAFRFRRPPTASASPSIRLMFGR
jgi:hypothetical protein